jgi:DNA-binding GntR family transcriptional regulator
MTEATRVYTELKRDIVTCSLAPGLSLSELEMCSRYNASRTPVREACRRLCDDSLMRMTPFRGYSITPLTIEEYRNLHELRVLVEPGIAALAAERATPEQLRDIELWASYDYKSSQKSSYYTSLEWNRKFHISIAVASRNQSLLEIITNTHTRLMRYSYLVIVVDSYGPQLSTEHKALVRAIRARNSTLARECALEHLNKTETRGLRVDWRIANLPVEPDDNIVRPPVASQVTAEAAATLASVRSKAAPPKRPRRKLSLVGS